MLTSQHEVQCQEDNVLFPGEIHSASPSTLAPAGFYFKFSAAALPEVAPKAASEIGAPISSSWRRTGSSRGERRRNLRRSRGENASSHRSDDFYQLTRRRNPYKF